MRLRGTVQAVKEWWRKETAGMKSGVLDAVDNGEAADKFWEGGSYEVKAHNERVLGEMVMRDRPVADKQKGGNWKPSNPKDLMGIRKVSLCCISGPALYEVALGMQEGGMKYGRHNYRSEGVAFSTYMDAAMRHMFECWEGEDIDPESGVHHVSKAISTLLVLRDALLNDKCTDDRPIRPKNVSWLKDLNVKASALVDKYPEPLQPYTHSPLPGR